MISTNGCVGILVEKKKGSRRAFFKSRSSGGEIHVQKIAKILVQKIAETKVLINAPRAFLVQKDTIFGTFLKINAHWRNNTQTQSCSLVLKVTCFCGFFGGNERVISH